METLRREVTQDTSSPDMKHAVRAVEIGYFLAAVALTAFYLATTLYLAAHRLFWNDEILTVHISRLPHWITIWTALAHAADSQPPIYYMVVRVFEKFFGHNEVAARLPSALAMAAAMLLTFGCARRLTDGLHGLIALSVLACSMLPYYGYEARPYAIVVMLSALALWIWIYARDGKLLSATFFSVVLFLGVAIHYYFVLCLAPYALWEITRWRPWQPPSPKLIAGVVGVLVPAALLSPLILSFGRQFGHTFLGHPSFWILGKTFSDLFPNGLLLLALVMVCIALVGTNDGNVLLEATPAGEVVGWLFLCMPLAGFALAAWKTNAFFPRYFIGVLPGVAVAFSCCLWRHLRHNFLASAAIFLLLATWGMAYQWKIVKRPESVDRAGSQAATRRYLGLESLVHKQDTRHILFFDAMSYLEAQYYSRYPEQCVLLLLGPGEDIDSHPAHVLLNLGRYYPFQFWELDDLKRHALDTVLIGPTSNTLKAMEEAGFKIEVTISEPWKVAYLRR